MKRFLAFTGAEQYPLGGGEDFRGDFDTLDAAMSAGEGSEWYNVIDTEEGKLHTTWDDPRSLV